jgi:hypothetical protein
LHPNRLALGVGRFGEQEQPVPLMVRPKATGAESEGQHQIAKALKGVSESPPRPGSIPSCSRRVLSENKARAKDANDADELIAQRRRSRSRWNSGAAVFLAGVASADEVNAVVEPRSSDFWGEVSDVIESWNVGPNRPKDSCCIGVNLHLPNTLQAGAFESEV